LANLSSQRTISLSAAAPPSSLSYLEPAYPSSDAKSYHTNSSSSYTPNSSSTLNRKSGLVSTRYSPEQRHNSLFSNLQADRRRFPFIPPALEAFVPPDAFSAADVVGPTLQEAVNIIHLDPNETVLDFMYRVNIYQEELNVYAAAPPKRVLSEIRPVNAEIMFDGISKSNLQLDTWSRAM
jgi:hypothetical protein